MFDKLIDILASAWREIVPFVIVEQWNAAVQLRFGKYKRSLGPGLWFKMPFADSIMEAAAITQSVNLPAQTLTTADEKGIVLKALIRYKVVDVQKYMLGVMHANDVLVDTTMGIIRDIVEDTEWAGLAGVDELITDEVRTFVDRWGIEVEKVTITDLAVVRTYRILGSDFSPRPLNND